MVKKKNDTPHSQSESLFSICNVTSLILASFVYNFKKLFIFLAVQGLSCRMQALSCSMWDLVPWSRIKPQPPCIRSLESWPLGHQESPNTDFLGEITKGYSLPLVLYSLIFFFPAASDCVLALKRTFFFSLERLLSVILFSYQVAPDLNIEFVYIQVRKSVALYLKYNISPSSSQVSKHHIVQWGFILHGLPRWC